MLQDAVRGGLPAGGSGRNENPSARDIKQILNSVGVDAEEDRLALVISQLKGKDVEEVIAQEDKPADDNTDSDSDGGLISLFD
ncbi:60S acidic ribosomal protein P2-like [Haliotis rufescens]|uniref:60S acidic ribosomal protein P2-like n=1 Tax=Haliotis rufescens TaxID=6454 RepID=UPI00201EAF05|nr:60S acidic ribosomal protein P2-like [Haliotis rufescens]